MTLKSFADVRKQVKTGKKTVALVCAEDSHTLEAVMRAAREGYVNPIFIGNRTLIHEIALSHGYGVSASHILEAGTPQEAAALGVTLVREGTADILMKGKLETAELLRPVTSKTGGLLTSGVLSHISINQIPAYHKLLVTTDGGMLPYPTLEQKRFIIENAVAFLRSIGYEKPKVCVLAAVETVNPKMVETVEADILRSMALSGDIKNCVVEGPISLDLALVKERALTKGYVSPCAGDADILVVPNIHAGNIMGKTMVEMAGGIMAGLVLGARCPIVLTSRGSSAEEKFNSLALACAVCN